MRDSLAHGTSASDLPEFADQVVKNQRRLAQDLRKSYDFIVCEAGSAGSVVARRLGEHSDINGLLIEAGGTDNRLSIMDPAAWPAIGSAADWGFVSKPNPHLLGRRLPMSMGRVLGGGSTINALATGRWKVRAAAPFAYPYLIRPNLTVLTIRR
jgi:choline dehydrogenase